MKRSCPQCGVVFQEKKNSFMVSVLVTLAKLFVFTDPAPTSHIDKSKKTYRCPNCGHEWSE